MSSWQLAAVTEYFDCEDWEKIDRLAAALRAGIGELDTIMGKIDSHHNETLHLYNEQVIDFLNAYAYDEANGLYNEDKTINSTTAEAMANRSITQLQRVTLDQNRFLAEKKLILSTIAANIDKRFEEAVSTAGYDYLLDKSWSLLRIPAQIENYIENSLTDQKDKLAITKHKNYHHYLALKEAANQYRIRYFDYFARNYDAFLKAYCGQHLKIEDGGACLDYIYDNARYLLEETRNALKTDVDERNSHFTPIHKNSPFVTSFNSHDKESPFYFQSLWTGEYGEAKVRDFFARYLPLNKTFANLKLPIVGLKYHSENDFVLVGRTGIFTFEIKNRRFKTVRINSVGEAFIAYPDQDTDTKQKKTFIDQGNTHAIDIANLLADRGIMPIDRALAVCRNVCVLTDPDTEIYNEARTPVYKLNTELTNYITSFATILTDEEVQQVCDFFESNKQPLTKRYYHDDTLSLFDPYLDMGQSLRSFIANELKGVAVPFLIFDKEQLKKRLKHHETKPTTVAKRGSFFLLRRYFPIVLPGAIFALAYLYLNNENGYTQTLFHDFLNRINDWAYVFWFYDDFDMSTRATIYFFAGFLLKYWILPTFLYAVLVDITNIPSKRSSLFALWTDSKLHFISFVWTVLIPLFYLGLLSNIVAFFTDGKFDLWILLSTGFVVFAFIYYVVYIIVVISMTTSVLHRFYVHQPSRKGLGKLILVVIVGLLIWEAFEFYPLIFLAY